MIRGRTGFIDRLLMLACTGALAPLWSDFDVQIDEGAEAKPGWNADAVFRRAL